MLPQPLCRWSSGNHALAFLQERYLSDPSHLEKYESGHAIVVIFSSHAQLAPAHIFPALRSPPPLECSRKYKEIQASRNIWLNEKLRRVLCCSGALDSECESKNVAYKGEPTPRVHTSSASEKPSLPTSFPKCLVALYALSLIDMSILFCGFYFLPWCYLLSSV